MHRLRQHAGEVRLPKGHVERGETEEEAGVREVKEETGLRHPKIVERLGTVENRFAYQKHRYERTEVWFLMTVDDLSSDPPEEQWRPEWYALDGIDDLMTFDAEKIALRW